MQEPSLESQYLRPVEVRSGQKCYISNEFWKSTGNLSNYCRPLRGHKTAAERRDIPPSAPHGQEDGRSDPLLRRAALLLGMQWILRTFVLVRLNHRIRFWKKRHEDQCGNASRRDEGMRSRHFAHTIALIVEDIVYPFIRNRPFDKHED